MQAHVLPCPSSIRLPKEQGHGFPVFIEREEQREIIRQECIAAHNHYQETGLHVPHAEVKEWIAQLRQGKKADAPKCHI